MNGYLTTTFSDDVRQEVGGKQSLIGVYSGVMFVPEFPITIPKLWLTTNLVVPVEQTPKSMRVRVTRNDDMMVELDATPEYLDALRNAKALDIPSPQDAVRVVSAQAQVCFNAVSLEGPCVLRVIAITDSGEYRGLGLQVQKAPA
jgi:hypothetical protein